MDSTPETHVIHPAGIFATHGVSGAFVARALCPPRRHHAGALGVRGSLWLRLRRVVRRPILCDLTLPPRIVFSSAKGRYATSRRPRQGSASVPCWSPALIPNAQRTCEQRS